MKERRFVAFVKFLGWWCFSLGIHIDLRAPHIALHFPGGFMAIGWWYDDPDDTSTWETNMFGIS